MPNLQRLDQAMVGESVTENHELGRSAETDAGSALAGAIRNCVQVQEYMTNRSNRAPYVSENRTVARYGYLRGARSGCGEYWTPARSTVAVGACAVMVEVWTTPWDAAVNKQMAYPEMLAELLGAEVVARRQCYITTNSKMARRSPTPASDTISD